jgi:hypothetical protein
VLRSSERDGYDPVLGFECENPPQAHALSPAGGAILGGGRKFRRWDLARGNGSLGV